MQAITSWRRIALRVVRFELRALLLTALAYGMVFAASPFTAPGTSAAAPRVVIIVGPAGKATDRYRADGDQAAKVARAAGATVTTVYSPNATWPKVKAALQGASIVVYMGHGNGFPSRYGPVLRKSTKNGVGLNPVAGVDDVAHQYFGESYLAKYVRLAPHAVVLLHHLCYASGNSEPGLPEGDLATGLQRVDNMAAGWLAAGAEAVLAEAYGDPAHYVGRILAGRATIEAIWRKGPTAHDNVLAFPSVRTPGMTALMDPTRKSSGFYRSLVLRTEMHSSEVAAGAALVRGRTADRAAAPDSPRVGPTVSRVTIKGVPTVGAQLDFAVAFEGRPSEPPDALGVGVRWDPLVLDPSSPSANSPAGAVRPSGSPASPASPAPPSSSAPSNPPAVTSEASGEPSGESSASPEPAGSPGPADDGPPMPLLVVPEILGEVVALADVKSGAQGLTATIAAPDTPGLYRMVTTIHDAEGAAFDTAAGRPVPALLVRVTRPLSAVVAATSHIDLVVGSTVDLPIAVMNSGSVSWSGDELTADADERKAPPASDPKARLVGHWVRLDTSSWAGDDRAAWTMLDPGPGVTDVVSLRLTAPSRPGEYLLILDVVSRRDGSLTAAGGDPVVVRVTVYRGDTIADP